MTLSSSSSTLSSVNDSFVILNDNRRLCYTEYKNERVEQDQRHLVLYFHGSPGYRKFLTPQQIEIFLDEKYSSLRLICVDRPGFGDSDEKPERTLTDYADDIVELLNALNYKEGQISIIGYSAGGPFALACGVHPVLSKKIKCIIAVSSLGPREQPDSTENMPVKYRLGFFLSKYWLGFVRWILRHEAAAFLRNPEKRAIEEWKDSEEDYEYIQKNEAVRKTFIDNAVYTYR
jgi:pimeloyl-ACP methyl ester carboxylesterase